jgi:hypothetical protein
MDAAVVPLWRDLLPNQSRNSFSLTKAPHGGSGCTLLYFSESSITVSIGTSADSPMGPHQIRQIDAFALTGESLHLGTSRRHLS